MNHRILISIGLLFAATACQPTRPPVAQPITAPFQFNSAPAEPVPEPRIQAATQPAVSFDPRVTLPYLASDELEGRGIALPGLDKAADYLADHFRAAGLSPLPGLDGYFQPFTYVAAAAPDQSCSLVVAGKTLKIDEEYRPLIWTGEGTFHGLVVFAGFGITSTSHEYDDYAGLDVRGKIVLAMRFEPMTPKGRSIWAKPGMDWSEAATLANKVKTAEEHGAAAILLFTPPGLEPSELLAPFSPGYAANHGSIPAFHVKRSVAQLVLGEHAMINYDDTRKPRAFADRLVTASGNVKINRTTAHLRNVVGCIPGAGPNAEEYVVVGAHYDHLGRGQFGGILGRRGAIYHGADDNASGTAALLELARMAGNHPPRQRTIVFCLFSAEEEGLIGSSYFVNHPPLDMGKVVAMLNMDMVGRVRNNTIYVGGGGTAKDLDAMVQQADVGQPLSTAPIPASVGGRGGLGPSDHMSFALKQVPVLFLFSGMHPDYHRPTDTANKINYAGIDQVAAFSDRLIDEMALMPKEPYDSSADINVMRPLRPGPNGDHLSGAALGVIPDYTTDTSVPGVLIQGVRPGSAADQCGLQGGDLLLQFGDKTLNGLGDLADCLATGRPGDKVVIRIRRGKQVLLLRAVLEARQG